MVSFWCLADLDSRLHHGGEAEAAGADAEFGEVEFFQDGFVDDCAGEDDVGAVRGKTDDGLSVFEGKTPEALDVAVEAFESQAGGFDAIAVVGFEPRFDAGEDAGGAAGGDELEPF